MNTAVVLNPRLKEIGFSKIMSAQNVIQEIELFLNKISNPETDIEFSNNLKIINAGFDKNSFRKTK